MWAADQPGYITFQIPQFFIYYNPSIPYTSTTFEIQYTNSMYYPNQTYQLQYQISSDVGSVYLASNTSESGGIINLPSAYYNPNSNQLQAFSSILGPFVLNISGGLSTLSNVIITLNYTIPNVKTKMIIPFILRNPPEGEGEIVENVPVYYTASPIVPSNYAILTLMPGYAQLEFNISDVEGCSTETLETNYFYYIQVSELNLVILKGATGETVYNLTQNSNIAQCSGISSGNQITFSYGYTPSQEIFCQINENSLPSDILNSIATSGVGGYLELDLQYNCSGIIQYTPTVKII